MQTQPILNIKEARKGSHVYIASPKDPITKIVSRKDVQQFRDDLLTFRQQAPKGADVIVDFGNIQYISTAILGAFIDTKNALSRSGGQLHIADVHPDLMQVFRITGLERAFNFPQVSASDYAELLVGPEKTPDAELKESGYKVGSGIPPMEHLVRAEKKPDNGRNKPAYQVGSGISPISALDQVELRRQQGSKNTTR